MKHQKAAAGRWVPNEQNALPRRQVRKAPDQAVVWVEGRTRTVAVGISGSVGASDEDFLEPLDTVKETSGDIWSWHKLARVMLERRLIHPIYEDPDAWGSGEGPEGRRRFETRVHRGLPAYCYRWQGEELGLIQGPQGIWMARCQIFFGTGRQYPPGITAPTTLWRAVGQSGRHPKRFWHSAAGVDVGGRENAAEARAAMRAARRDADARLRRQLTSWLEQI